MDQAPKRRHARIAVLIQRRVVIVVDVFYVLDSLGLLIDQIRLGPWDDGPPRGPHGAAAMTRDEAVRQCGTALATFAAAATGIDDAPGEVPPWWAAALKILGSFYDLAGNDLLVGITGNDDLLELEGVGCGDRLDGQHRSFSLSWLCLSTVLAADRTTALEDMDCDFSVFGDGLPNSGGPAASINGHCHGQRSQYWDRDLSGRAATDLIVLPRREALTANVADGSAAHLVKGGAKQVVLPEHEVRV